MIKISKVPFTIGLTVNHANNHDLSYSLLANHVRPTRYESCKIEITAFDNVISTVRFDRKFDKRVVGDITPTFTIRQRLSPCRGGEQLLSKCGSEYESTHQMDFP